MKQSYYQALQSNTIRRGLLALALSTITLMGATGCQGTKPQPTTVPTTTAAITTEAAATPPITTSPEATTPPVDTSQAQALAQNLSLNLNAPYTLEKVGKTKASSTTLWKTQEDTYTLQDKTTDTTLGTLTIKHLTATDQAAAYLHVTFQGSAEIIGLPQSLTLDFPMAAAKDQYTITNLNPVAGPTFYQSPVQSLFISALQNYQPLSSDTYQRQPNPEQTAVIDNQTLHLTFPVVAANIAEYWLVISPQQLLDPQDQTEMDLLKRMDFDKNRQWSTLGNMEPLQNTNQTARPALFSPDNGYHVANRLLQQGTSPFSSIYAVAAAQQLLSRFPETGLSADGAAFTANLTSKYQLKEAKAALDHYIDFYKTYIVKNNFLYKKANRVYRLPLDNGEHTSLSLTLSQANLLYNHYLLTADKTSKELANELIESLSAFGKEWIKPDGGLWYAYQPSTGFILAGESDVTLNDLYRCQASYLRVNNRSNTFIKEMIVVLEAYVASGAKK